MSLKLHSIINGKTPATEYVWLKASAVINLHGYAIVDRTFDAAGKVSNEFRHIFVFPSLEVGIDDWVRLFSGNGKYSTSPIKGRSGIVHNFYWQADSCVWNNNGEDRVSLIKYQVINTVDVSAV